VLHSFQHAVGVFAFNLQGEVFFHRKILEGQAPIEDGDARLDYRLELKGT
jgi:hypothetical protein